MRSIIFLLFFACAAQAQVVEVKGSVTDKKTGEPLPYASISLRHFPIGTVTNESGEFQFFIPDSYQHDTLVISCLGYHSLKRPVLSILSTDKFALEESVIQLKEVTIEGESARDLLQKALQSIEHVCPVEPYLMEGFHRSWERIRFADGTDCPGTLIEAAITIVDPGYVKSRSNRSVQEDIFLNEIRRSALQEGWNYGTGSALRDLLDKNLVKYTRTSAFLYLGSFLSFPNDMVYTWEGETTINEEKLSIIRIDIPNTRQVTAYYRVYISESDHAILRFTLHAEKKEVGYDLGPWHLEDLDLAYDFKRIENTPYLNYVRKHYIIKKLDTSARTILRTEEYHRELMVNKIVRHDVESKLNVLAARKAKEKSLAIQTGTINEAFWSTYNGIKDNRLDSEIVAYFEKSKPCPPQKKHKE